MFKCHANATHFLFTYYKNIKTNKTKPKKGTRIMLGDIGTLTTQINLQKNILNTKLHVNKMMVATT